MRWKGLILIFILSAILTNYNVQSSEYDLDEDVESVETNNEVDEVKQEEEQEKPKVSSVETKVDPPPPDPPKNISVVSIAPNITMRKAVATGEKSGKYSDYPYMSQLDLNDQNYDWNGEFTKNNGNATPFMSNNAVIINELQ